MATGRTFLVTGASGAYGRKAVEVLRERGERVIAGVRDPAKVEDLAALGAEVRVCDYDRPETLAPALAGVDRILLVSSNEVGRRVPQHAAVIEAARAAGCSHLAYTSILHGLGSPLALAAEHQATERLLLASGVNHTALRNAWYSDNFEPNLATAASQGAIYTAAGHGRFAPALRSEMAEGGVALLTTDDLPAAEAIELAGSASFSMPELANALSAKLGKQINCVNLPPDAYGDMLKSIGIPGPFADILVDSEINAESGAHSDSGRRLERLIGRPPLDLTGLVDLWSESTAIAN